MSTRPTSANGAPAAVPLTHRTTTTALLRQWAPPVAQLQREAQLYTAQTKNTVANSRQDRVKKEWMKKEVTAVKDGVKVRPHFPKRSELRRAVISDTFERLEESGGKIAVDRYLTRKVKRSAAGGSHRH